MNRKSKALLAAGAISLGMTLSLFSANAETNSVSPYVDDQGNISFPETFREDMIHLGSWYVPEGEASGFHGVYTELASAKAFQKTGKFPDGATLVKELRSSVAGDYTTGENVSRPTKELKQWFVMVKDTEGRFEDNPIWGDGWGWALFAADDKTVNISTDYQVDCLGCHTPAEETDYVYTEAYPILFE